MRHKKGRLYGVATCLAERFVRSELFPSFAMLASRRRNCHDREGCDPDDSSPSREERGIFRRQRQQPRSKYMKRYETDSARTSGLSRREFIRAGAGAAALGIVGWPQSLAAQKADGWDQGQLAHLIPTASHERFLIKTSFKAPLSFAPQLSVNGKPTDGVQTDSHGRFWRFDVTPLNPATEYELRITDPGGAPLCDAWLLKTFPAPGDTVERLRILDYTCAGGYDGPSYNGKTRRPVLVFNEVRRKELPNPLPCPVIVGPSRLIAVVRIDFGYSLKGGLCLVAPLELSQYLALPGPQAGVARVKSDRPVIEIERLFVAVISIGFRTQRIVVRDLLQIGASASSACT